ncbi:hypothetical protein Tco_0889659 [Tanacetum coccineum]
MTPQDPAWHMDTGALSYLNFNASNFSTIFDKCLFPSVHVGDDNSIPVTNTGHSIIPSIHRTLHLHNVLVTPNIIKNLIFVCQFTRDNNCTIEFDAFSFSVKDFLTRHILFRCDSSGDLYPVTKPSTTPSAFLSTSASTWHQHLDHPGDEATFDGLDVGLLEDVIGEDDCDDDDCDEEMSLSIEEDEVSLVDGVLEGAFGALGDDSRSLGDEFIVSSFVMSMKSCFGGMMVIFGFFDG